MVGMHGRHCDRMSGHLNPIRSVASIFVEVGLVAIEHVHDMMSVDSVTSLHCSHAKHA
jgi:hypothetical protein